MRFALLLTALLVTIAIASSTYASFVELPLVESDEEFVKKASLTNLFVIEASKLALAQSKDEDIQEFAEQMVADHTKLGDTLKSTLKTAKLRESLVVTSLDKAHQKKLEKLRGRSGVDFDDKYLDILEDVHQREVKLFERYSEKGKNQDLRTFAINQLPILREHKEMIDELD